MPVGLTVESIVEVTNGKAEIVSGIHMNLYY